MIVKNSRKLLRSKRAATEVQRMWIAITVIVAIIIIGAVAYYFTLPAPTPVPRSKQDLEWCEARLEAYKQVLNLVLKSQDVGDYEYELNLWSRILKQVREIPKLAEAAEKVVNDLQRLNGWLMYHEKIVDAPLDEQIQYWKDGYILARSLNSHISEFHKTLLDQIDTLRDTGIPDP